MTDPLVTLEPGQLSVEPGGQASVLVTIHNPGTIVESYTVEVLGEQGPIGWAEVIAPASGVYPQQQGTWTVVFKPPTGAGTPSGLVPFGIKATSDVDPTASAVAEGELTVGQVSGLQAKLTPVTSSGRWRGRHTVQISNWGNSPATLRLVATDPDQALGFLIRPDVVEVPLGGSATARLKVRIRKPVLRGAPTRLGFQVVGEPATPTPPGGPVSPVSDPGRPVLDGAVTRKPILSRFTVSAAALTGLVAVATLVFALTRQSDAGGDGAGDGTTVPAKPRLVAASTGPFSTTLSWDQLLNIDSYTLHGVDPVTRQVMSTQDGINAQQNALKVEELKPVTQYCYALRGVNGDKTGPLSDPVCITTAPAPPPNVTPSETPAQPGGSQTPPPGQTPPSSEVPPTTAQTPGQTPTAPPGGGDAPVFAPEEWIGVVELQPGESGNAEPASRQLAQRLGSRGIPAKVLFTTGQYQGLRLSGAAPPISNAWVVYVGPAAGEQQVRALCGQVEQAEQKSCSLVVQPGKAG